MTIVIPDAASLGVFAAAAIALLLTPGPAVLYIVARSVEQGRVAGLVSVCGIVTGTLVHVLAATAGLSALLASSALAFGVVKYAGAAYLVYLGVRRIFVTATRRPREPRRRAARCAGSTATGSSSTSSIRRRRCSSSRSCRNSSIPRAARSPSGGLPRPAVRRDGPGERRSLRACGRHGRQWFKRNARVLRFERYVTGSVFIGLGAAAAYAGAGRK